MTFFNKVTRPRRTAPGEVTTKDLALACLGLGLMTTPLWSQAAGWAVAFIYGSIGLRLLSSMRGWALPSQPVKLLFLTGGCTTVVVTYGTVLGMEPGLGILLFLVALKLLETRTARDFQVLILLGYFLGLCGLFFFQDLGHWLYIGGNVALLTGVLVRFHLGGNFGQAMRRASLMAAQALPIIILLYLFFPRIYGGFRIQIANPWQYTSGMSDKLEPGSVAALANDRTLVFRVTFPDGNMPPVSELYWRGIVLWKGDGLSWARAPWVSREWRPANVDGPNIRQSIIMQPNGSTWLCALDRPCSVVPEANYESGGCLRAQHAVNHLFPYEISSRPLNHEQTLVRDQQEAALALPQKAVISRQVKQLVQSWRNGAKDDRTVVVRALEYFHKEPFTYSLTPGPYPNMETAMDEFLFQRRAGFCEHYAGAFATLMRVAGIPSRVVMGYLGGSANANYVEVYQSDAHAWCEVWIKDQGWERIDPTNVIAPDRVSAGLEASHAANGAIGKMGSHWAELRRAWDRAHLLWANLTFQWDLRVLNYDSEHQKSFLAYAGFGSWRWNELALGIAATILILLGAIAFWIIRPTKLPQDPAVAWFDRFSSVLARGGVERGTSEGPLHFVERAARHFPEEADSIRQIGELYVERRYGKGRVAMEELAGAVRGFRRKGSAPAGGKDGGPVS